MIASELTARGHEAVVLCGSGRKHRQGGDVIREGISAVFFRGHSRVPFLGARSAHAALRRLAPDVVYVRGRSYLAAVAAWERWRRRTGFVWASNGEDGCERWKRLGRVWGGSRPLVRKLLRTPGDLIADVMCDMGVHRADQHICQTQSQHERLWAVHRREGLVVRSVQMPPPTLPPEAVPPLVIWIGRVSPERRPEAFIELARGLEDLDCEFALVGPAADSSYLERVLIAAHGLARFRYVGEVPFSESWDWIARAAVLINTSPVEGVSNALVQAWHCGTATVALSFDPDGIIEANEIGFRSGDSQTMIRHVRRLVTDGELRRTMGARALALARREFSGESVGAVYEAVMMRAMGHV